MNGEAFGLPTNPTIPEPTDDTPALDPATFDIRAWANGIQPTIRSATLYQRADLLAEVDELMNRLRVAEEIPAGDRGLGDETPDMIREQLAQVAEQFEASAVTFKVQGRSDAYRDRLKKQLKKRGITDETEIVLHELADAIVEPANTPVDVLRQLGDVSEAQLKMLLVAASMANYQPPKVDVDFSSASSKTRAGGRR